jgi:hypothetical protein
MQRRCKHVFPKIEKLCFLRDPFNVVRKKNSVEQNRLKCRVSRRQPAGIWDWEHRIWISLVFGIESQSLSEVEIVDFSTLLSTNGSSSGDGSLRWYTRNGKEGIRLWKEDCMCDLKWQWDCCKLNCKECGRERESGALPVCKMSINHTHQSKPCLQSLIHVTMQQKCKEWHNLIICKLFCICTVMQLTRLYWNWGLHNGDCEQWAISSAIWRLIKVYRRFGVTQCLNFRVEEWFQRVRLLPDSC